FTRPLESAPEGTFRSKLTLVPPKVGGLGGQNSVSKNLGDILSVQCKITFKQRCDKARGFNAHGNAHQEN
ncbi:hypothetical protein, partial [Moorena sp. SIO4G3]|uniref:hypothetical protein n=1 Tax=Moorena sp. SIO4G3 TaxID=2607821 RepID=UPI0026008D37